MYLPLDKNIIIQVLLYWPLLFSFKNLLYLFGGTSVTVLFQDTKGHRALPTLNSPLNGAFVLCAVLVGNGCYLGLQEGI